MKKIFGWIAREVLAAFACVALAPSAHAANRTWVADVGNVSDPANWDGHVPPTTGDRLVFPRGTATVTVDSVNPSYEGIDVTGGKAELSGNPIVLTGSAPITASGGGELTLRVDLTFAARDPTITTTDPPPGQIRPVIGLGRIVGETRMTFSGGTVRVDAHGYAVAFVSDMFETSPTSFNLSGPNIVFSGANHTTGSIDTSATLVFFEPTSGPGSGPLTVKGTGRVDFMSGSSEFQSGSARFITTPLVLSSAGVFTPPAGAADTEFTGETRVLAPVTVTGTQYIHATKPGVSFDAPITGAGTLFIEDNNFFGTIGPVTLNATGNSVAGVTVDHGARLDFGVSNALASTVPVSAARSSSLRLYRSVQTFSSLSCDTSSPYITIGYGSIRLTGHAVLNACNITLDVPPRFAPVPGRSYTLVENLSGARLDSSTANTIGVAGVYAEGGAVKVNGTDMRLTFRGGASGLDMALVAPGTPPPPSIRDVQDLWWSGPAENGWGMSIVQHGDALFAALYVYGAGGAPLWFVLPSGVWDATHTSYSGSLYWPLGTPYFAYDASALFVPGPIGSATITFRDESNAILDYTVFGVTKRKVITREVFAAGPVAAPDRSDLWWGGQSQNGWGITMQQQGSTLVLLWFTYDSGRDATWYVMPGGAWTTANTYEGHVYRTTGSSFLGDEYDPSLLKVFDAGTFRIHFTADGSASFDYNVDGHSGTMPLVREPF